MSTQFQNQSEVLLPVPPVEHGNRENLTQSAETENSLSPEQALEQADHILADFEAAGLPAAKKIANELDGQVDAETKARLELLNEQAKAARDMLSDTLMGRLSNKVSAVLHKNLPDSSLTKKFESKRIVKIAIKAHDKIKDLLHKSGGAGYAGDMNVFPQAISLYEKLKPTLEQAERTWIKRDLESELIKRLPEYTEYLTKKEGWEKALEFYIGIPRDLLPFETASRCAYYIFEKARLTVVHSNETLAEKEINQILKEKFKDNLDILAMGASWNSSSDSTFVSSDKVEFIRFFQKTGRFPEMIAKYTQGYLTHADREIVLPILFRAYLEHRPQQIVYEIKDYKELYEQLPLAKKQEIIAATFASGRSHWLLDKQLDDFSTLPLTDEQRQSLKTNVPEYWLRNVLKKEENLAKVGVTKEEVIDILSKNNGVSLLEAFPELNLSEDQKSYVVRKIYGSEYPAAIWLHFNEASPYLSPEEVNELVDKSVTWPYWAKLLIAAADLVPMTDQQKETLVNTLLGEKETTKLLESFQKLNLAQKDLEQLVLKLAELAPDGVINKYGIDKSLGLSPAVDLELKHTLVRLSPASFLYQFNSFVTDQQRKELAQSLYLEQAKNGKLGFLTIKRTTEVDFEYTEEAQQEIYTFLQKVEPSKYNQHRESLRDIISGDMTLPEVPWQSSYEGLRKLQAQSENEAYDPWITDLDPLVKNAMETGLLDPDSQKDGQLLYDYVHTYGMYNLPTILRWHVAISKAKDISDIPQETRAEISSNLGVNIETLSNKGFITREIRQFRQRIQAELLHDNVPPEIYSTDAGLELFLALKGSTKWNRDDDPREIIKTWVETLAAKHQLGQIPEGYEEVALDVPLAMRKKENVSETEERLYREKEILANKELNVTLNRFQESYGVAIKEADLARWWERTKQGVLQELVMERDKLEQRLSSNDNEKARASMGRQLESLDEATRALDLLTAPAESAGDKEIITFLNSLVKVLPKKTSGREDLLRQATAFHSLHTMSEAQRQAVETTLREHDQNFNSVELQAWRDHLVDYMNEHYLHPQQAEHQTGHSPFSADTLKELQFMWGTKDINKNILVQSEQKLQALNNTSTTISNKKMGIALVPVKGVLRVYSGDLGDACYTSQHKSLAEGDYPGITGYVFVTGRDTNDERLRGSVLAIETKTPEGESVLVVRANNPQENLLSQVDSDSLVQMTLEEMKKVAARRGIKKVVVPRDNASNSCSNRAKVAGFYASHYENAQKVGLVNQPETNFNGYAVWNKEGSHAVVEIT